jgi:hypothetical protein
VIICALDDAYINATSQNSNGCLNRFFGNSKRLPRLLFQRIRWPNRDGNGFGKRRRSEKKCHKRSPYCEDYSLIFGEFAATKREISGADLPTGAAVESINFLSVEGGYMKRTILAGALLTFGCFSLPVLAQQQDLQEVMNATNALGARENELLGKKDAAGIASLFTSDGLLVMLAPQFAFKPGRDAILKHYQGIIDAGATELRGKDSVWAAGTYSVTVKDKTIQGNWFRLLKGDNGAWKIAMEAFARAIIDAPAAAPANNK